MQGHKVKADKRVSIWFCKAIGDGNKYKKTWLQIRIEWQLMSFTFKLYY